MASRPAKGKPDSESGKQKTKVDWERVEMDFRAGVLSLREIGEANGCSHVAVTKRAKAEGWVRDLQAKIQAKADALVNRATVNTVVNTARELETVDANAAVIAEVRLSHRKDIGKARSLAIKLLDELEVQTDNIDMLEQLEAAIAGGEGSEGMLRAFQRVTSTAGRIDSAKKLAEAMKVLVTMEREAYNIDAVTKAEGVVEAKTPELRLVLNGVAATTTAD